MKVIKICTFLLLFSFTIEGQIVPVSNDVLGESLEAFQFIDSEIKGVQLVGIGEATHGTSEFKTIQSNLFKYLVEKHNYTIFFLEDEYVYSLPIDRYIKGGEGNIDSLVSKIRNWPWQTPQMKSLILWMRSYNESNNNVLSFVGTDFQDHEELKEYLETEFNIQAKGKPLSEIVTLLENPKHSSQSELILKSLHSWINGEKRDEAMADLILKYLELNSQPKGVFIAHNVHLLKIKVDKKNDKKDFALAGGQLDYFLKEKYYVLGTDFNEGAFYAHSLKKPGLSRKKYENHEFKISKVSCANKKESLCKLLSNREDDILFITNFENTLGIRKWVHINDIGATFYAKKNGKRNKYSTSFLEPEWLDAILYFKNATAATIFKD